MWSEFIYLHTAAAASVFLPLATHLDCCTGLIIKAELRLAATVDTQLHSAACIYS